MHRCIVFHSTPLACSRAYAPSANAAHKTSCTTYTIIWHCNENTERIVREYSVWMKNILVRGRHVDVGKPPTTSHTRQATLRLIYTHFRQFTIRSQTSHLNTVRPLRISIKAHGEHTRCKGSGGSGVFVVFFCMCVIFDVPVSETKKVREREVNDIIWLRQEQGWQMMTAMLKCACIYFTPFNHPAHVSTFLCFRCLDTNTIIYGANGRNRLSLFCHPLHVMIMQRYQSVLQKWKRRKCKHPQNTAFK